MILGLSDSEEKPHRERKIERKSIYFYQALCKRKCLRWKKKNIENVLNSFVGSIIFTVWLLLLSLSLLFCFIVVCSSCFDVFHSTVCFTEMHRTTEPKKKNSTQTVKYSTSHLLLQCIWHGLNRLYRVFNCSNRNILIPLRPSNVWRRYFVTIYTRLALIQSHATHILSQLMFDSCSALNPCVAYHSYHSIPLFDSLIYVSGDIFFSLFSFLLFVVLCLGIMNNAASFGCVCVCVCDIADSVNWYASANKETWLSTNRRKNWHTVRIVVAYLIQWLRYIFAFICPRLSVHSLSLSLCLLLP